MNAASASSGLTHIGSRGLRPREADRWGPGVAMAFGVHLMLVAALALGVRWKLHNPEAIEAEVWSEIPKAVAPADVPAPPVEQPIEKAAESVPPVETPPPLQEPIPELAVAKKQPKKERKKAKAHEPVETFETTPPKASKKPEKKPEKKVEKPPAKVVEVKKTPAPPVKPVASKVTSPDGTAQAVAEREARHKAQLQRMMNELGALGSSESSAGPSASYAGRIRARIKPRIVFTDNVSGNPTAVVEVRCGPNGNILARKLIESSGVPRWDEAVLRAIDATEVLPVDESGKVPPVMQIAFRPNDL